MIDWWRDLRIGFRRLLGSPVASSAAVITLALGIGATTAIFSVADGVLFRPLSFPESNRLVQIYGAFNYDEFRALQTEARTLESIGFYRGISVGVTGLGEPERIRGEYVTSTYFDVLGVGAAMGRVIEPGEDVPGGELTAVLSHGYWQRSFGGDPAILGRTLYFNDTQHTIVGVMPPDFRSYWDATEAWLSPQTMPYGGLTEDGRGYFLWIGRLAEGVDFETAHAEVGQLLEGIAPVGVALSNVEEPGFTFEPLTSAVVGGDLRVLVWVLVGAATLVLLIATANVAGLQIARAGHRHRELAIRSALGGNWSRLFRQLLVENLVLAAIGGLFGLFVASAALRVLQAEGITPFLRFDVELNAVALVVAGLLTLGAGMMAGIVSAMRGAGVQPAGKLRDDDRSGGEGRDAARFRSGLVVGQMAMAVTLLVGASLLLRTAAEINRIQYGFDPENVLTAETRLTSVAYEDQAARRVYLEQILDRLTSIPGVRTATLIKGMPFAGDDDFIDIREEGSSLEWDEVAAVNAPPVAGSYFELMGIPILAGRAFERSDGAAAESVLVLSRSLAERLFRGGAAVGRMVETPEGPARVIGVVEDTREDITPVAQETAYIHYLQAPPTFFSVMIRTDGPPETFARPMLDAFWSVDPNQPLWEVMTLERRMGSATSRQRFFSVVLGGFAGVAVLLAAVGLYGVMAHVVGRRRRELGIRIALGAGRANILQMVFRQGLGLTILGVSAGVGGAFFLVRLLASMLFGVNPHDSVSFVAAPALLVLVAILAIYVPARRATRVDPVEAIRG